MCEQAPKRAFDFNLFQKLSYFPFPLESLHSHVIQA